MYAQRFSDGPRFRPASLGAAIAINGAFIAALILANPDIVTTLKPEPTVIFDVKPDPIPKPKPEPRQAKPDPAPSAPVVTPDPIIKPIDLSPDVLKGDTTIIEPIVPGTGAGTGTEPTSFPVDLPIVPKFIAAREDPRYISDFQPPYPDYERDAGREDVVKLRIRIGADGRVKQVERLAGKDSFARASIAHALSKWRFQPATRGGVPEESWKVMTVRFTLNN